MVNTSIASTSVTHHLYFSQGTKENKVTGVIADNQIDLNEYR
jgi:hypothetical protein